MTQIRSALPVLWGYALCVLPGITLLTVAVATA